MKARGALSPQSSELQHRERGLLMKRTLLFALILGVFVFGAWGSVSAQPIENELYLITPVPRMFMTRLSKLLPLMLRRNGMWT